MIIPKKFVNIDVGNKDNFKRYMLNDNMIRCRIISKFLIAFEVILATADITASMLKASSIFRFDAYLIAYLIMIIANISYMIYLRKISGRNDKSAGELRRIENSIIVYITFIQTWGSIVSLMDQELYGQLMVFMVNMITCSVMFYLNSKQIIIPYTISLSVLLVGLPFFQKSSNMLIGHYINISVFVIISFACSRILYYTYCDDYIHKSQLSKANKKLEELSLFDELTFLPNRRSYDQYIGTLADTANDSMLFSSIMMDIDFFKEFNDIYGHKAGDECLSKVAAQIQFAVNGTDDFAARIGGEEFVYISTSADDKQIKKIAETIRQKINDLKIPHKASTTGYLTISLGTSTVSGKLKVDLNHGVELADKALYIAKASGRNCVKSVAGGSSS